MPPALNYFAELGQVRCQGLVGRAPKTVRASTGCWLFNGSRNTDGYGQVYAKKNSNQHLTGRSSQTAFLLHVVA